MLRFSDVAASVPVRLAAERVGVTAECVKRWIRRGRLPGFRTPGGHWRVRLADLQHLVEGGYER